MVKQFYFNQFNLKLVICLHTVKVSNCSVRPIDRILTRTTTPSQSEPGSNGNEGVLRIPQTIRWYCIISRTLVVVGVLSLCRDEVSIFHSPS